MEWPPPLKLADFTFDEDLLLMAIYFTEPAHLLRERVVMRYEQAHCDAPQRFPKQKEYTERTNLLFNRITSLIADSAFAAYREVLVRVFGVYQIPTGEDHSSVQYHMQERALLASEAQKYGKDKLRVTLPGAQARTFTSRRVQMCQNSDLLTREALASHEGLSQEDQTLQVYLSEDQLACPVPHTPAHFSPELFERFLLFTRHPLLLQELEMLERAAEEISQSSAELTTKAGDLLTNRRKNRAAQLDEWRDRMERAALDEITQEFARAVEATKARYERLAVQTLQRLNETHADLLVDAMEFYGEQQQRVSAAMDGVVGRALDNARIAEKHTNLIAIKDTVFAPPDTLPHLLVLGAALESRSFVTACEHEIAANLADSRLYTKFVLAECQLMSSLIFQQILARAPDRVLAEYWRIAQESGSCTLFDFSNDSCRALHAAAHERERTAAATRPEKPQNRMLEGSKLTVQMLQDDYQQRSVLEQSVKNQLLPLELIAEEVRARRAVFYAKYSQMSDVQLRDLLSHGTEPFSDVLQHVIDERLDAALQRRPAGDAARAVGLVAGAGYLLSDAAGDLRVTARRRFVRVRPAKVLSSRSTSRVYAEVYVKSCPMASVTAGVFIAYPTKQAESTALKAINAYQSVEAAAEGVFLTSDGFLQENTQKTFLGREMPAECVLGVLVDCAAMTVEFRVNGQKIQDAYGQIVAARRFGTLAREQKALQCVLDGHDKTDDPARAVADGVSKMLDFDAVRRYVVLSKRCEAVLSSARVQERREETEFYIGCEVYCYGTADARLQISYSEPFMMPVPAGYGTDGWV